MFSGNHVFQTYKYMIIVNSWHIWSYIYIYTHIYVNMYRERETVYYLKYFFSCSHIYVYITLRHVYIHTDLWCCCSVINVLIESHVFLFIPNVFSQERMAEEGNHHKRSCVLVDTRDPSDDHGENVGETPDDYHQWWDVGLPDFRTQKRSFFLQGL